MKSVLPTLPVLLKRLTALLRISARKNSSRRSFERGRRSRGIALGKVAELPQLSAMRRPSALLSSSIFIFLVSNAGCVTYMPVDEYNIARTAYDAAKDADAPRYSPAFWFSTEQAYHSGEKAFEERDFANARRLFIDTRDFAEKAENAARLARHQSGDVVP